MSKKFIYLLFSLLLAASMAAMFVGSTTAADQSILCNSLGCTSPGTALFSETNVAPGDTVTKTLEVKNQRSETLTIELSAYKKSGTDDDFLEKVDVSVDEVGGGNKYSGSLGDFLQGSTTVALGSISASSTKEFDITLALEDVGNEYQGKGANFDISVDVAGEPDETGSSSVSGSSASSSSCGASVPTSAPILSALSTSDNTVLLTWTSVDPVTHYAIRYGYSSGAYSFGATNVGNTTSYTVRSLAGETTYFFQVAGVNDCAPGPWSNEAAASPAGAILGFGPAPGFERILGTATESAEIKDEEVENKKEGGQGQILAEGECGTLFPWWAPLILQLIITVLFIVMLRKEDSRIRVIWILLTVGLLSQIFHILIGCPCSEGNICQWYGLLNILIITFGLYLHHRFVIKARQQ